MGMEEAWLLPAVLVVTFLVVALFGRFIPRRGDFLVLLAGAAVFVMALLVLDDFQSVFRSGEFLPVASNVQAFDWINIANGFFIIEFSTYVDAITVTMLIVVSSVALAVMVYSVGYMHGEVRYGWYFSLLAFFTAAMLALVISGNFIVLYLAWEGVGLASYLLIGFYWERQTAAEAAKKAFITTRIGDVGLLIGIILLWRVTGTFDIQETIQAVQDGMFSSTYLTVTMILIFAGAAGKSAQFPFHVWLPDAMEGPTPVSALIHAATMVVAGVYLIARLMPIYDETLIARDVVLYIGLTTAFIAATMALVSNDIKRVLAYSTVSQLGFMFVALGLGAVTAAMFHLLTHAFFKALLFLGSGSVIHGTGEQEMEQLGGLRRKMPVTAATFIIGGLALAGVPFFAGFWSKDEILAVVLNDAPLAVYVILAGTAVMTAIYTTRLIVLTFFGEPRNRRAYDRAHESPAIMTLPLIVLAVMAAVAGFITFPAVGEALGFVGGFGELVLSHGRPELFHFNSTLAIGATLSALAGIGIGIAYWGGTAQRAVRAREWAPEIHALLVNRYYIDHMYQAVIDRAVMGLAHIVSWFDRRIVNESAVDGGAQGIGYAGLRLKFLQTGRIPNYALAMALGAVVLALLAFGTR